VRSNNKNGTYPLVIFCHNLTDTGNFGALLRSAYWFNVDGVAFPIRASAKPDAFTVKTSSGASEGVNLFTIRDTTAFLTQTRKAGWEVIAAMPPSSKTHFGNLHNQSEYAIPSSNSRLAELRQKGPVLLILGGEEFGIPFSIAQHATGKVSISGDGENELGVDSLNVSVAGSLILSEFARPLAPVTEVVDTILGERLPVEDATAVVEETPAVEEVTTSVESPTVAAEETSGEVTSEQLEGVEPKAQASATL
jgi:21S rRNA (GM2251-2'-O)-methyltransferase